MMKLRHLFCSIWLLLSGIYLLAQPPHSRESDVAIFDLQADMVQVLPCQNFMWEINRQDLVRPSYIYGILYKVPENAFFLAPGLTELIETADHLVFEINPTFKEEDFFQKGEVPFDSTLDALVPKRVYKEVLAFFQDSLSAVALYKLEQRYMPILVCQQMLTDYCIGYKGYQSPINYEYYISDAADASVKSLNTEWARDDWIDDLSIAEQTAILMSCYDNRRALKAHYQEFIQVYRRGDLDALQYLARDLPDLGGATGKYIEAKNEAWAQDLEWQMQAESLFIAVNASQLAGEKGLLHLLRLRGFDVRPVYR